MNTSDDIGHKMRTVSKILRRDDNCGGVLNQAEHIAWLMFLKFLDEEEKRRARGKEPYTPVLSGELSWDNWASPQALEKWDASRGELVTFVRGRLLPGLASLSGSPLARTISRIFSEEVGEQITVRNVPVCASDYNLRDVINIINSIHFDREGERFAVSLFYEDMLSRLGQENQIAGEFHTPRPVIRFMVDVIDPRIGETVYDPACGTAGFLAQAYLHMEKQARAVGDLEKLQHETFYGQEKKGLVALLGTMNLVLHGVTSPNIDRVNTLEENVRGSVGRQFDVIFTNPPFGGLENTHIQRNFPVQCSATELLFLQHILKKLKDTPNARAGVVVPEGIIFRGGAFAEVKKWLMDDFHLFAVVSLPPGVFAPYSDVKTALLFFRRAEGTLARNPAALGETWYYELPLPEGLKKFGKGSPIQDEHFAEARALWQRWRAWIDGEGERPFLFADEIRSRWQAFWEGRGERPEPPYNTWVERAEDLRARNYDLSARNPHQDDRQGLPPPAEITARMLGRLRDLQERMERLHLLITEWGEKDSSSGMGNQASL